jgi:hypothetical protein
MQQHVGFTDLAEVEAASPDKAATPSRRPGLGALYRAPLAAQAAHESARLEAATDRVAAAITYGRLELPPRAEAAPPASQPLAASEPRPLPAPRPLLQTRFAPAETAARFEVPAEARPAAPAAPFTKARPDSAAWRREFQRELARTAAPPAEVLNAAAQTRNADAEDTRTTCDSALSHAPSDTLYDRSPVTRTPVSPLPPTSPAMLALMGDDGPSAPESDATTQTTAAQPAPPEDDMALTVPPPARRRTGARLVHAGARLGGLALTVAALAASSALIVPEPAGAPAARRILAMPGLATATPVPPAPTLAARPALTIESAAVALRPALPEVAALPAKPDRVVAPVARVMPPAAPSAGAGSTADVANVPAPVEVRRAPAPRLVKAPELVLRPNPVIASPLVPPAAPKGAVLGTGATASGRIEAERLPWLQPGYVPPGPPLPVHPPAEASAQALAKAPLAGGQRSALGHPPSGGSGGITVMGWQVSKGLPRWAERVFEGRSR